MKAPDAPLPPNTRPFAAVGGSRPDSREAHSERCSLKSSAQNIARRMAAGTLTAEEVRGAGRQLVRNVLRGCPGCAAEFGVAAGLPAATPPVALFHYDAYIARAIRLALENWRKGALAPQATTFEGDRAAALIAEARKLRRDDPAAGLELLDEALRCAQNAEAIEDEPRSADFACEIYTERANLFRLLGRHREAEHAFRSALAAWNEEAGHPDALLSLGDLYGSFLLDRRRFAEADLLLARLIAAFRQRGEAAWAGKLAVQRTQAAHYANLPERALRYSLEALALVRNTDLLELRLNAIQHHIVLHVELGNYQDASDYADAIRTQYRRHMGAGDRTRFLWADARIFDGLRRHGIAESLFRRVKAEFEQLGLPFDAALVGLDLAVRLVERGHSTKARALLADELIPTFRSIGVAREGIASLLLLERATQAAALDAALLKSVLRDLERAGKGEALKRETGPDGEGLDSA